VPAPTTKQPEHHITPIIVPFARAMRTFNWKKYLPPLSLLRHDEQTPTVKKVREGKKSRYSGFVLRKILLRRE